MHVCLTEQHEIHASCRFKLHVINWERLIKETNQKTTKRELFSRPARALRASTADRSSDRLLRRDFAS
jgi:hypothetical protein